MLDTTERVVLLLIPVGSRQSSLSTVPKINQTSPSQNDKQCTLFCNSHSLGLSVAGHASALGAAQLSRQQKPPVKHLSQNGGCGSEELSAAGAYLLDTSGRLVLLLIPVGSRPPTSVDKLF